MKWFFTTLNNQAHILAEECIPCALAAAFVICAVYFTASLIKKQKIGRAFLLSKVLPLAFLSFITALILYLTLGMRVGQQFDSLAIIWGGWLIIKNEYSYDFSAVQNIIMFVPLSFAINIFREKFLSRHCSGRSSVIRAVLYSLSFSAFIEGTQCVFQIGTLQISDLVYNTLGGLIGALLFGLIKTARHKRSQKNNTEKSTP